MNLPGCKLKHFFLGRKTLDGLSPQVVPVTNFEFQQISNSLKKTKRSLGH